MIILAPTKIEWTSEDAVRLKEFLNSQTGNRVMQVLALGAPELLDGTHKNKTLVSAGMLTGYQEAISNMVKLTYENPNEQSPETAPTSGSYQSLDDDSAWVDIDKQPIPAVDKPTS